MTPTATDKFWSCQCITGGFVHPVSHSRCLKCGVTRSWSEASRPEDVILKKNHAGFHALSNGIGLNASCSLRGEK